MGVICYHISNSQKLTAMKVKKNPKADLRKFYHRSFEVSLIFSLAAIIVAFKFSPQLSNTELVSEEM